MSFLELSYRRIGSCVKTALGYTKPKEEKRNNEMKQFLKNCLASIVMLLLMTIFGLIALCPLLHLNMNAQIQEFKVTKQFFEEMRKDGSLEERMATALDIVEMNRWLASAQYWNSTILGFYVPNEVDELEPIGIGEE